MLKIIPEADICGLTTFRLPAVARQLVYFNDASDLREFFTSNPTEAFMVIGGGSNLLFTTGRYEGTVLAPASASASFSEPDEQGFVTLKADAGCVMEELCRESASRSLWGLENLSGIPGCVGGAAVQNVGAYGAEFKDVALSVRVFDTVTMQETQIPAGECRYGYRSSLFKLPEFDGRYIILGAIMRLSVAPAPRLGYAALATKFAGIDPASLSPSMLRNEVIALRDSKLPDPAKVGSAGSFFKNPVVSADFHKEMCRTLNLEIPAHVTISGEMKLSAAWLIDHAGCKPLTAGGAALWQSQPLVIVNACNATGQDVLNLENMVRRQVKQAFGVDLSPEVIHI